MKSKEKINSDQLNFKWDKDAKNKLEYFQSKMSFDDYIRFIEQFKPTEEELREIKNFTTKFTL
jgi:hypothetical protein